MSDVHFCQQKDSVCFPNFGFVVLKESLKSLKIDYHGPAKYHGAKINKKSPC